MSHIDTVKAIVDREKFFNDQSGPTYVRIMDTPRIWGAPFNKSIMPAALARAKEFEGVISEIIQKTKYRCDVASLNSPDPSWTKVILEAMDMALTTRMKRDRATQFRFLFGQTPTMLQTGTPPNFIDFQGSLIRLVRSRSAFWERMPEIWLGRFFRLQEGVVSGMGAYGKSLVKSYMPSSVSSYLVSDGEEEATTKMTWNHSKIIASDGAEALVGGHNLNMDLFTSYPPVHDVSVAVHGAAAYGAQLYLNQMWECKTSLLIKERLDVSDIGAPEYRSVNDDSLAAEERRPLDPLVEEGAAAHRDARYKRLAEVHGGPIAKEPAVKGSSVKGPVKAEVMLEAEAIRAEDLQTLRDLEEPVFQEGVYKDTYAKLPEYKRATRILSVGKYWAGPDLKTDYKAGSELMKQTLIMGAQHTLKLSQMDLVSAWKKTWQSHVVCHWLMEALLHNKKLVVQVVVSPLNAGAGAEGDQYSFGSGACRTFDLIRYYSMHGLNDKPLGDVVARLEALDRLHIAPLYFTDVPQEQTVEGETYHWPELDPKGWTQTLRQPSLTEQPPKNGIIGDAVEAAKMGSGMVSKYKKVRSAPGNHAKIMIIDDESYVVGSDNLYPGFLSEFNYLVEGKQAVGDLLESYWNPLWWYSGQHCVNPACRKGCTAKGTEHRPTKAKPRGSARLGILDLPEIPDIPLLDQRNVGRVQLIELGALAEEEEEDAPKKEPEQPSKKVSLVSSVSSEEVSKGEKEKRAQAAKGLGVFLPDDHLPDLTAPGYYFTENDIYNLQRYALRALPNVAVIEGVVFFQWEEMNRLAYTTEIHPAITTATDTIIQSFHVGGNHWALLYIMLGPAGHGGNRPVKLLYADPLNPNAVPVNRLGLLRHPFPGIQAEHSLVKYQDDRAQYGQNSCGAWVVHLATELARNPHRLPAPALNPHQAALDLRRDMNGQLEAARAHPRPVAPDDPGQWVQPPPRQHGALPVRPGAPRGLQRTTSLGSLGGQGGLKRSASLGDLTKLKK